MGIKIKDIIFVVLFFILMLSPVSADNCFPFEGTYVGVAILNGKESEPLFLVIANNHITGFLAPENQTHPQGDNINQTDLSSGGHELSITTDGKILVKYPNSDILNGKAKLIEVKNGSGTFHGYYRNLDSGRDFLNVGEDGGAVLTVTAGRDYVFAFGKINSNGQFVQVFPENGKGPQVDITISGTTASFKVLTTGGLSNGLFTIQMQRSDVSNCGTSSPMSSSSSSGGTSSGEPVFVTGFKTSIETILNRVHEMQKDAKDPSFVKNHGKSQKKLLIQLTKKIERAARAVKSALKAPSSLICQGIIDIQGGKLSRAISNLRSSICEIGLTNPNPCLSILFDSDAQLIDETLDDIAEIYKIDDNGNGITDLCEQ